MDVVTYAIASVILVSAVSFVGVAALAISRKRLQRMLLYMVAFSAGALLGDVFFHLLPETVETVGFTSQVSLYVLSGIAVFFVVEKVVLRTHASNAARSKRESVHSFAVMNLLGDGIHNFIDGLIIGASYIVATPIGIATTLAVVLHEIPQEIGDFGVLMRGGFSRKKALLFNFITALTAVAGAGVALALNSYVGGLTDFLIPFAAGGFIYIAGADLIPELHKESGALQSLLQTAALMLGLFVMLLLKTAG
ncbi:MAG: ZIP family metal transporter [Candidatus Aenigmatarchaeota archaeon]|nr:MAG: ZIP family metal transporter [Candidatus Aenigmarchaeota archaeon]